MVTTTSRMFDQQHGKHLKRVGVVRGLVSKILGQYPDFDKKVITKTIRVITLFHVTPVANLFYVRGG